MSLKIKGWSKFQHFKDRKPPWIKLYRDILDDVDWHDLDSDSAKILVMLWLIASEDDGDLPELKKLAFRLRISESKLNQSLTKLNHWLIQDDINVISERYQSDAPETEKETETYKEETESEREITPRGKNSRGSRLPTDSTLAESWILEACNIRKDWDIAKVLAIFSEFKDYWIAQPGQKGVKTDWLATWRNWVRREKGFNRQSKNVQDARLTVAEQIMGGLANGNDRQVIDITQDGTNAGYGARIPETITLIRDATTGEVARD